VTCRTGQKLPLPIQARFYIHPSSFFHFAGGVGCGGAGGAGGAWLSGGKVFKLNSSRSAALAEARAPWTSRMQGQFFPVREAGRKRLVSTSICHQPRMKFWFHDRMPLYFMRALMGIMTFT
jgi:hypothetical protein